MKVLSLFDGMSCGRIALERAGLNVDAYYASEVDKHAIAVAQDNYPDNVQLGDVTKWREWDIDWGSIDLLMGGSPCQGFSFAGKQLAFDDPRSALFFEYVNILSNIKKHNPNVKFLLENNKMKKQSIDVITGLLSVNPVKICSSLVSAQKRERLYWSNIKNITQPKDKKIKLQGIIIQGVAHRDKSKCVRVGGRGSSDRHEWDMATKEGRRLTAIECERLQTVPDNYTRLASNTQRFKMLGNGWTVDVIAHILGALK